MNAVPYLDLSRARERFRAQVEARWRRVLDGNAYVLGAEVRELERAFADLVGAPDCVAVANGTDALTVALRALALAPGAEVIVPAFSFFATAEAVVLAGGIPVFADIDPATFNLDPEETARRVTSRTAGVVGVHLYGRPFDADAIDAVCAKHGLWLLEDAAQAHGARYRGRRAGTLGRLAAWSFYPTKNLGAFGDGGAITGPDATLLARARRLANHGQTERYHHVAIGTNSRLDSLQAAVLNCRLPLLEEDNARRRALARLYAEGLSGVGDLRLPVDDPRDECVYHQMTIATARRDALMSFLKERGIGSSVHYPSPLHRQPAIVELYGALPAQPEAERAAAEVLCLPMFPELGEAEVERVVASVREFFA